MSPSHAVRAELNLLRLLPPAAKAARAQVNLDAWAQMQCIETEAEYCLSVQRLQALRAALERLADAGSLVERIRVREMCEQYEDAQSAYNACFELREGDDRAVARYMIWNKVFVSLDRAIPWLEARDRGLLRKAPNGAPDGHRFYVLGLRYKVGSDMFDTIDGRSRRQFVDVVGRLAIRPIRDVPFYGEDLAEFAATVPDLDTELWTPASIGGDLGSVKLHALSQKERLAVHALFTASPHASRRAIRYPAVIPGAAPPTSPPTAVGQTADLFAFA